MIKLFTQIANNRFGATPEALLSILESSAGIEGYILGALGEMHFKQYAEANGFEVLRIKEKPEGGNDGKSEDARGDFYIRPKGSTKNEWLVVECKSVKSNAEARSSLLTKKGVIKKLYDYTLNRDSTIQRQYKNGFNAYSATKANWKNKQVPFPPFRWSTENPAAGIPKLPILWRTKQEIEDWVNQFPDSLFTKEAYWNKIAPVRLIQTHMPSTRTDSIGIKSTGPLVTEFNILCLDLFLRTGKHDLIFVNSQNLNHQAQAPNHLQQNYTIDLLVEKDGYKLHDLQKPWYNDLTKCIIETKPIPRHLDRSQLDNR